MLLCGIVAVAWAVSFGTLPPADFAYQNGEELKTLDPSRATGQPEHRVLNALFEGLLRDAPTGDPPDENGNTPMHPSPAMAESYEVSQDGRVYTFKLRENARWTNGDPVTAEDFVWSWRRTLHPDLASEYAYQLYYIVGAQKYNQAIVELGDKVEIEIDDRADPIQPFPRGTILNGIIVEIVKPSEPHLADNASEEDLSRAKSQWKNSWVYKIDIKPARNGKVDWDAVGEVRAFCKESSVALGEQPVERCLHVLIDFHAVGGAKAHDDRTLEVTLNNSTPFFPYLVAFYPLFPLNRRCIEEFGAPNWTKPENIVTNGPYKIEFRRIRDRIRLVKNLDHWDAENAHLNIIDAMAIKSQTTALNMYLNGQIDWVTDAPQPMIPILLEREDCYRAPALITYFYRLNTTRPPLNDVRVRRALNMAMNKREICEHVKKSGDIPARGLVPPGIAGYTGAECDQYNIQKAKQLLDEADFPGGKGMPTIQILYNTNEAHRSIAEVVQQHWKNSLGIDVELRNLEWGTYLDTVFKMDYTVARAGWVGDYPDPNTFLDMFVTDGPQNNTGWSSKEYDRLIEEAATESDPQRRMQLLHEAEVILMDNLPIIPIYFYSRINIFNNKRLDGFFNSIQDIHPLHLLEVNR
jgi:oligopeptide transport system substrate-binding protein